MYTRDTINKNVLWNVTSGI